MRGISTIIVAILLLMISVSLAGFGYMFFTTMFSTLTTEGEEVLSTTVERMLAQMKIESISGQSIYVRNTGKINLTNFNVYVENNLAAIYPTSDNYIDPGDIGNLTLTSPPLSSGNVVKVTSSQGATAVQTVP